MHTLTTSKSELVEKLGIHFEKKDQLAPVAARILAYVILTGKQGTTFDDLVSNLCASKSTISTHLNHLQALKKITYYTKTGDRKKYFIKNRDAMIKDIEGMVNDWESQKQLHLEIVAYKEMVNETLAEEDKFDFKFHNSYIKFLDEAVKSINELKQIIIEQ